MEPNGCNNSNQISEKKSQNTIFNYFKRKKDKNENEECYYCRKLIPTGKILWHKDFECHNKPDHVKNIIPSKKFNTKKKLKRNLSNSDSSDIIILDVEDNDILLPRDRNRSSPVLFNLNQLNDKDVVKNEPKLIDVLRSDWDSPEKSPLKASNLSIEKNLNNSFSLLSNTDSDEEFQDNVNFISQSYPKQLKLNKSSMKLEMNTLVNDDNLSNRSDVIATTMVEAILSDSSCDSFEDIPKSPNIVSPIRTPTPSPSITSSQKSKSGNLSQYISSTPQKFNVKKRLIDTINDEKEDCLTQVSSKATPPNVRSQFKKINLPSSCAPEVSVQKNPFTSTSQKKINILNKSSLKLEMNNLVSDNDKSFNRSDVIVSTAVEAIHSDSSSDSFEDISISQNIVCPIRTPTPSPSITSSQKSKSVNLSPYISSTPQKFNVKRRLIDTMNNENEEIPSLSQDCLTQVSSKTTTPNVRSQFKKMNLPSSCALKVSVRKNLFISSQKNSPSNSPKKSPYKYRSEKGMYLFNFEHIISIVVSETDNLLLFNNFDTEAIVTFNEFSLPAKKLFVRLFQRKLKWNRVSKLEYKEICDKEDMFLYVNELVYADFLLSESKLSILEDILALLDINEVRKLCKEMKLPVPGSKENSIKALLKCDKNQKSMSSFLKTDVQGSLILKKAKEYLGKCFIVNKEIRGVFMRILHLYCPMNYDEEEEGGQQSQLTALLMLSLGKMKFPSYQIKREHILYRKRDDLVRFQTLMHFENEIQECIKNQNWDEGVKIYKQAEDDLVEIENDAELREHDTSLPAFLNRFTILSFICHLRNLVIEIYQRQRHYGKAVKMLEKLLSQTTHRQDCRGRWYDRLALNLHQHLKRPFKALQIIKEAMEDPEVRVGYRLSLSQRAERILNSKAFQKQNKEHPEIEFMKFEEAPKICIQGKSLPSDMSGFKRIYLSSDDNENNTMCSVEELVLAHYKKEGYPNGLHSEGRVVGSIFGFFFWDILYLPITDAFRTKHQAFPLDLDSPEFYFNRKKEIDKRLSEIPNWTLEEIEEKISEVWKENIDCVSIIDWNIFSSVEFLMGLIVGLGSKLISAICERLAKDHRFTRSGFPDLIVWNPANKRSRIVEVKGPNDKLSTKQILWLDFLISRGASAEVCHVEAVGLKRRAKLVTRKVSPRKRRNTTLEKEETSLPSESPSVSTSSQSEFKENKRGAKRKRKA